MAFMLKVRWDISDGREVDFKSNQAALRKVMLEHPGVICYHADYPSPRVSEWIEIYATVEAFSAHLENDKGKAPLGALIEACDKLPPVLGRSERSFQENPRGLWRDIPRDS
jgi:hypothetical protein